MLYYFIYGKFSDNYIFGVDRCYLPASFCMYNIEEEKSLERIT
jgi:hypothetical protein